MLCTDDMVKSADGDKTAKDKLKGMDYKCSKKDKEILLRVVMQAPVEGDKDYDKDYAAAYTSGSPYTILWSDAVAMGDPSKKAGEYADTNPYFKLHLDADGTEAKAAVEALVQPLEHAVSNSLAPPPATQGKVRIAQVLDQNDDTELGPPDPNLTALVLGNYGTVMQGPPLEEATPGDLQFHCLYHRVWFQARTPYADFAV